MYSLYCIYDTKAEAPLNGIFQSFTTDAAAVRMFQGVLASPQTICHEHPGDFQLCRVSSIDYADLSLVPNSDARLVPVASGDAVVRQMMAAASAPVDPEPVPDIAVVE